MEFEMIGKYKVIELLGSGATSDVYKAKDTLLGREIALKILKPSLVTDDSAFARFAQEAQAAAKLFHPNIATVLDMGEADGRYFIAIRYIPGFSLDRVLKEQGSLPLENVVQLAQQIGSALDYAHSEGFLHRDVKPSNIVLTPNGEFVLTDFGLTRAMMSTGITTHTGAVLGTPPYIAPEIWLGEQSSPATDQYALACVIYEALTGKVLFLAETPPAIMKRHFDSTDILDMPHPELKPAIIECLQIALDQDPVQRYPCNREFSAALAVSSGVEHQVVISDEGNINEEHQMSSHEIAPAFNESRDKEKSKPRGLFLWGGAVVVLLCLGFTVFALARLSSGAPFSFFESSAQRTANALAILVTDSAIDMQTATVQVEQTASALIATDTWKNALEATDQAEIAMTTEANVLKTKIAVAVLETAQFRATETAKAKPSVTVTPRATATTTSSPTPSSTPSPTLTATSASQSYTVQVPASQKWVSSGASVKSGQTVKISASGTWTNAPKTPRYGPGTGSHRAPDALIPAAKVGILIGRIGGQRFVIGSSTTFVASNGGTLELSMNDTVFSDNEGTINVSITISP